MSTQSPNPTGSEPECWSSPFEELITIAPAIKGKPTNRTGVLTAKEFVNLVCQGEACDWKGRRILGNVNLAGVTIRTPLVMRGTVFAGEVNFSRCRFERKVDFSQCRFERGADFTRCRFERKVIFSDARVEGPLILNNVVIDAKTEATPDLAMIQRSIPDLRENRQRAPSDRSEPQEKRLHKVQRRYGRRTSRQRWEECSGTRRPTASSPRPSPTLPIYVWPAV